MNVCDGNLYCFNTPVHANIIAYDIHSKGCLYLTENGKTHFVSTATRYSNKAFINRPDALDVYLFDDAYVFTFRNRIEICRIGRDATKTISMTIKPDFQMFPVNYSSHRCCYINGGTLYDSNGIPIVDLPEYEFIWFIYYDSNTYNIEYVDYNGKAKVLSNNPEYTPAKIEKVLSTDDYDLYFASTMNVIMYHRSTKRACVGPIPEWNLNDCQFSTNGYQWTVSNGREKRCYYGMNCDKIPIDAELCWSGHRISRMPTKSARF